MSKTVHLRLTGRAEKFVEELTEKGFNEREIIARALWLFETAVKTKRVALLNKNEEPQYIFTLQSLSESSLHETEEPLLHDTVEPPFQETFVRAADVGIIEPVGEYYEVGRERAGEFYQAAQERAGELTERAKEAVAATKNPFSEALEAGKEAYTEEKRRAGQTSPKTRPAYPTRPDKEAK